MPREHKTENGGTLLVWEKGESGNPAGRPKNALKKLSEETGINFKVRLTRQDKATIMESMLEKNMEDLKSIATDKRSPAFMVIIANAIKTDIKNGRMTTLDMLLDRFYGRPAQSIHLLGATMEEEQEVPLSEWTDAEIEEELKRLEDIDSEPEKDAGEKDSSPKAG